MISITHAVPGNDVLLGVVRAEYILVNRRPSDFDRLLTRLLERRRTDLDEAEERRRVAARDMLRKGRYKPTGRGKPASEYLLRAAERPDYVFPSINGPVDVCNYLSLKHVLPISLWDLDRTGSDRFVFRLGKKGEGFVFNEGGQVIDLEDLLVGCRVDEGDDSFGEPIVNPVKDSLATKTTAATRRIAASVYTPAHAVSESDLSALCKEFADLLAGCGDDVDTAHRLVMPDSSVLL